MIIDVSISGVIVGPQRRQHGKASLLRHLTFGVGEQVLVESVWVSTVEVQTESDVAIRVNLTM